MLDRGTRTTIAKHGVDYLFEDVTSIIGKSDFTIANFESSACDTSLKPQIKKFTFRAKPEWLSALLRNGITHVSIANNHSFDFGEVGFRQTTENIKSHGINLLTFCDSNASICEKNGSSIAIFSTNFLAKSSGSFCVENEFILARHIKHFKAIHPASVVIIFIHWGTEMQPTPSARQIMLAHEIIDAGADAIVGHHPHVVQSVELFKGRYIFYSLGNFIFDFSKASAKYGIVAKFSISKGVITSVQAIPYNINKSKPTPMNDVAAEELIQTIQQLSPTVKFKRSHDVWKIL